MAGGLSTSRKTQSSKARNKQRTREVPGINDRRKPLDPPWRPEDDYLLIHSVFVTSNLSEVQACVRFTRPYTEAEIEQRWRALLFNPLVSVTARDAIARLPAAVKSRLDAFIPFASEEDNLLLSSIPHNHPPSTASVAAPFEELLSEHLNVFYTTRTPSHLRAQWNRLQSCRLVVAGVEGEHEGGDAGEAGSFSDTELLMEEIVARDLTSGLPHLLEPSTVARRRRQTANENSYHGFQARVGQAVAATAKAGHQHEQQHRRSSSLSLASSSSLITANQPPTVAAVAFQTARGVGGGRRIAQSPSWAGEHRVDIAPQTTPLEQQQQSESSNSGTEDAAPLAAQSERHRYRRRLQAKISRVEEEACRWTALAESVVPVGAVNGSGSKIIHDHQPTFPPTLATLTGRRSRFLIKCKHVTFGRGSSTFSPDIDLSCEAEVSRVSRRHGKIFLTEEGVFWLTNLSKHAVLVDGNPVLKNQSSRLYNKSIICVSQHLFLRFDVCHGCLGGPTDLPAVLDDNSDTGMLDGVAVGQEEAAFYHRSTTAEGSGLAFDTAGGGDCVPVLKRPRRSLSRESNPGQHQ